jgi:zinc transport system substrate-binding protein
MTHTMPDNNPTRSCTPHHLRHARTLTKLTLTLVLSALLSAFLVACGDGHDHDSNATIAPVTGRKPVIVASIFPLANLIEQVAGDTATVVTFMPPGSNPHGFEPSATQMTKISNADLLVVVGLGFDDWAQKAGKNVGKSKLPIVRWSDLAGIKSAAHDHAGHNHAGHDHSHGHDHSGPNPHLWLDPVMTADFITKLTPALMTLIPEQADAIKQRSAALLEELVTLHEEFKQQLAAVPNKQLVTFHNAFDLTAKRYGLDVVAHLAELDIAPGGDVSPKQITDVVNAARKYKLKVIYTEPQFPKQAVETVQREAGLQLLPLDPEGDPVTGGYKTYQDMMRWNLKNLVQGQSIAQ